MQFTTRSLLVVNQLVKTRSQAFKLHCSSRSKDPCLVFHDLTIFGSQIEQALVVRKVDSSWITIQGVMVRVILNRSSAKRQP